MKPSLPHQNCLLLWYEPQIFEILEKVPSKKGFRSQRYQVHFENLHNFVLLINIIYGYVPSGNFIGEN